MWASRFLGDLLAPGGVGWASCDHTLGSRGYLAGRYISHLELAWDQPVPGPILLGSGRYFGLGVMLPVEEQAGERSAA